jgi:hypothetical protein
MRLFQRPLHRLVDLKFLYHISTRATNISLDSIIAGVCVIHKLFRSADTFSTVTTSSFQNSWYLTVPSRVVPTPSFANVEPSVNSQRSLPVFVQLLHHPS